MTHFLMARLEAYNGPVSPAGTRERGIKEPALLLGEIFTNGHMAANRIRGSIPEVPWKTQSRTNSMEWDFLSRNVRNLRWYLPPNIYNKQERRFFGANPLPQDMDWGTHYWITDKPNEVFGEGYAYTVTSSLAVKNLKKNIIANRIEDVLVPPIEHMGGIQTHKGIGLHLLSRVMENFGIRIGEKDRNVWLAPQIDAEQLAKDDSIARNGSKIDKKVWSVLFENEFYHNLHLPVVLHPQLEKFISAVIDGGNIDLYQSDADYKVYADTFLEVFGLSLGVRDGWYEQLEGIMTGTIQPIRPPNFSLYEFKISLFDGLINSQIAEEKSQAVVLQIDKTKLFEEIPLYAFPISTRPPGTILPAPRVPIAAVTGVYIADMEKPPEVAEQFKGMLKPFTELPDDAWLPDKHGQPVTFDVARGRTINPHDPLCSVRYVEDPVEIWMRHIESGAIAPLLADIKSDAVLSPTRMGERALQRLLVQKLGYAANDTSVLIKIPLSGTVLPSVAAIEGLPYR